MEQRIDGLSQFSKQVANVKRQLPKSKDFTNMDLSHLDLSGIEPDFWENAIFHNTNFSNTGIRFCPRKLKNYSMINCNFENVDLSYITEIDLNYVHINGCNFRNTNLNVNFDYIHSVEIPNLYRYSMFSFNDITLVKLDELYSKKAEKFWTFKKFNMETFELNPFIKISPDKLLQLIKLSIPSREIDLDDNEVQMWIEKCENWIAT